MTYDKSTDPRLRAFNMDGKVALITGGGRGLGLEMAHILAAAGADVVVASRRVETCEAVAEELQKTYGHRALALGLHVGDWDAIEPAVDRVIEEFGRLDVLINNAGIAPTAPTLLDVTEELFDKTFAVNTKGPYRLMAVAGDRMQRTGGGSIINVSSMASVRPSHKHLTYAAAKAGLNVLTTGFAQALGPQVRVNTILAGPFFTDISKAWDREAFDRKAKEQFPLQRGGDPSEIAGAALYLASDASSFTTGSVLAVDGGRTAAE